MAEGKKHLRMRGVKQASKRLQDDLLGRSKDIAENPSLLRPMCAGNCRKCVFDKVFKDVDKVVGVRNDESACLKYANKGFFDDMAKAYAGTVSLSAAGKLPLLATAAIAGEKVPYAVRGSVNAKLLIGVQHYDDPKLRLLYYNDIIKKNRLHLYSFTDGLVCSDEPNMPEDYFYDIWWSTPYKFKDDESLCGHEGSVALEIRIKSLDQTVHICEDCAKDVSTLMYLVSKMCALDVLDDIEVKVLHKYHAANESGEVKIESDDLKQYMVGAFTDKSLIEKIKREKLGILTQSSGMTLIIGEKNYGSNLDSFISILEGPQKEKDALKKALESAPRTVILKNGKTSEAITVLWDDNWRDVVGGYTSKEFAANLKEKPKSAPAVALEELYRTFISADVVNSLPTFNKPGYMTQLADSFAKAAKVGGLTMLRDTIFSSTIKDSKSRALATAFTRYYNDTAALNFTVSKDDLDFAEFLRPFVKKIIEADGKTYRDEMNTLLMACGAGESV